MTLQKTIFINSHPIQYFAPLYRYLNEHNVPAECWYCSDENVKGHLDRQFGARVEWDIPILEGYSHKFFRNYSPRPSLYNGFFGLWNPGMVIALFKEPKSTVVVHGWSYMSHILVLIFARIAGHRVCLRGENPLNQEMMKARWLRLIKRVVLQGFLFRFVHHFLFIGSQNRRFYKYYGVSDLKLIFTPYAVDNDRFQQAAKELKSRRSEVRRQLGIPEDSKVILFTAKFIDKKKPMDLLEAFELSGVANKCLVMVGDGELRPTMERYVKECSLRNVFLTGFINQSEIVKYYASADIFVLCSGAGETWGLSVNEAMNFGLPVVVSDMVGCCEDLVEDGSTGYISRVNDVDDLVRCIAEGFKLLSPPIKEKLDQYSYDRIREALLRLSKK